MTNIRSDNEYKKLKFDSTERAKELAGINRTTGILKEGKPIDETLQYVCDILPDSWQYPDSTAVKIEYDNKHFITTDFVKTQWSQKQKFKTIDNKKGYIEVCYLKEFPEENEGPFLKEERDLIENITLLITGYLNEKLAKAVISGVEDFDKDEKLFIELLKIYPKLTQIRNSINHAGFVGDMKAKEITGNFEKYYNEMKEKIIV